MNAGVSERVVNPRTFIYMFVVGLSYQKYGFEVDFIAAGGFFIMGLSEIAEQIERQKDELNEKTEREPG